MLFEYRLTRSHCDCGQDLAKPSRYGGYLTRPGGYSHYASDVAYCSPECAQRRTERWQRIRDALTYRARLHQLGSYNRDRRAFNRARDEHQQRRLAPFGIAYTV